MNRRTSLEALVDHHWPSFWLRMFTSLTWALCLNWSCGHVYRLCSHVYTNVSGKVDANPRCLEFEKFGNILGRYKDLNRPRAPRMCLAEIRPYIRFGRYKCTREEGVVYWKVRTKLNEYVSEFFQSKEFRQRYKRLFFTADLRRKKEKSDHDMRSSLILFCALDNLLRAWSVNSHSRDLMIKRLLPQRV